ncbi:hypothetical protein AUC45_13230 [Erythrobacter sp. YT30]|nr:hypothetical protein AUC45_13230 [Erythrobacter sp. YT30]
MDAQESSTFSPQNHKYVAIADFLHEPEFAITTASLQKFAKITPQYPGIRSELPLEVRSAWLDVLAPMLNAEFGKGEHGWDMQAWFSLVTAPAEQLLPLQRFPHVDGTDPRQIAMMLYLQPADHGGTGFFRHISTGFEALTAENFPHYKTALEADVRKSGLPEAAYVTDGSPFFERIHQSEGAFNQAVFYRGNVFHSGMIKAEDELSPDPKKGRLTINSFFRPKV